MFLVYRGSRELALGILPGIIAGINEAVKLAVKQPRPDLSCLTTYGMPSSHSAVSVGLLVYLILDAAYRITPKRANQRSCGESCMGMVKGFFLLPFGTISQGEFSAFVAVWTVLLLPVPLARVIVNDHSPQQAMAGVLVGLLAVAIWFPTMLWARRKLVDHVGTKAFYIFVHNYDVPAGWKDADSEESQPINSSKAASAEAVASNV